MLMKIFLIFNTLYIGLAEREHKVHNIILYPEKHSWCQTTPIQQVVASPGYEPVTIDNNVCVGACYSYSIPSTQPAEPGELIGPYCDSCQPAETKCYHVTLRSGTATFQKRVQIIMNCSCQSCEKIKQEDCEVDTENTLELPQDLFSNRSQETKTEEVPELLHFAPNKKRVSFDYVNSTNQPTYELNTKLINLLKSIQNEGDDSNISYDKEQLKELLKIIEGSESELSDKNLMEFVNFVNINNSEDLEVDLSRLKEVLKTFEKNQEVLEEHGDFGLGLGQKNNADIESDLKKYNLPSKFGIEGVPSSKYESVNSINDNTKTTHHHHLGEEIAVGPNLAQLVKGPHGSLVLAPNLKVEEKLNIDSDVLKPNHDGVVISYENHNKNHKLNDILTN